jgi:hypothetical protein
MASPVAMASVTASMIEQSMDARAICTACPAVIRSAWRITLRSRNRRSGAGFKARSKCPLDRRVRSVEWRNCSARRGPSGSPGSQSNPGAIATTLRARPRAANSRAKLAPIELPTMCALDTPLASSSDSAHSASRSKLNSDAVARHRSVTLEPVAPHLAGYGAVGQAKWAAWRSKEHLESVCEENLDDQIALVASCLDSVFANGPE